MKGRSKKIIQKPLIELFKLTQPKAEVPKDLKEEVFKTIDNLELTADFIDLFTFKYAHTNASLLGELGEEEE